ncbi:hypothetical protein [Candidatus Venteria ishoeyi]|uniref:Uncharacterized protein n=1 Tax=Candidatus Venteria ishoeyi TaxID=1899563 RepID=A0A1H6FFU1_9GAMM|nr:hypothetical protein [Candidatus Venteria ishoeyi]MDM8546582.1 hypothetical protein [Candidatus Venteria ishoeyi]SEH08948.1 Uncharacterised protein [Candidatus Venteria ishoeyi]
MRKLLLIGCKTMREGVVVSFIFFIFSILMILAATNIVPTLFYMNFIILLAGFSLLLFAPLILVSTYLLTVLPGMRDKLKDCEH